MAELLYYALTTGRGLQTLGEEYCDLLQASGVQEGPPGSLRRGALVLLQSLAPYLLEKGLQHRGPLQSQVTHHRATPLQATISFPGSNALSVMRHHIDGWVHRCRANAVALLGPRNMSHVASIMESMRSHSGTLLRLHLAIFYVWGLYYQISKRLTKVRYVSSSKMSSRHPSYAALGIILLAQLGIAGAFWAKHAYQQVNQQQGDSSNDAGGMAELKRSTGHTTTTSSKEAVLLATDGSVVPKEFLNMPPSGALAATGDAEVLSSVSRKCPLCLSARIVPTATSCGHVFCWRCIVEWAATKPECPICRSEVQPQTLVVVRHADF